jgi:hypothetical protein
MVPETLSVPETMVAFVAVTVKLNGPDMVGVPLTEPLAGLILTESGSAPLVIIHVHVHGLPPSVALRLPE